MLRTKLFRYAIRATLPGFRSSSIGAPAAILFRSVFTSRIATQTTKTFFERFANRALAELSGFIGATAAIIGGFGRLAAINATTALAPGDRSAPVTIIVHSRAQFGQGSPSSPS
jgi:hypothetical protein